MARSDSSWSTELSTADTAERCARIERLLELVQVRRGLSRRETGSRLGRHIANLVPASGNPKLDLLVRVAAELDWSVAEVVDAIWQAGSGSEGSVLAGSPEARAGALLAESRHAAARGRFEHAIRHIRRGLRVRGLARETRRQMEASLAESFVATWALIPGTALIDRLLGWYSEERRGDPHALEQRVRMLVASANGRRRLAIMGCAAHESPAELGRSQARLACELLAGSGREAALLLKARALCAELDVITGHRSALEAIGELEELGVTGEGRSGSGWANLCAANIIRRRLPERREALGPLVEAGLLWAESRGDWDLRLELTCVEWGLRWPALDEAYWPREEGGVVPRRDGDIEARIRRTTMALPRFFETGLRLMRGAVESEFPGPPVTERIEHLYAMACEVRGWNRTQLAEAVGRHLSNLVPTGSPKSDLLLTLARALDWTVDDVVLAMVAPDATSGGEDAAACGVRALEAWRQGEPETMREWALRGLPRATPGRQRANMLSLLSKGWEMSGRFRDAEVYARRAVHEPGLSAAAHFLLADRLAFDHFLTGDVESALAVLQKAFADLGRCMSEGDRIAETEVHSHWLRGMLYLRLACLETEGRERLLELALADIENAEAARERTARASAWSVETERVLHAARLEIEVELERRDATQTIAELIAALDAIEDPRLESGDMDPHRRTAMLQTFEFWCYTGLRLARRRLSDAPRERATGIFSNKGLEISERLGDWSLRLQMFSADAGLGCAHPMDWSSGADREGEDGAVLLDDQDAGQLRMLMAALPGFFEEGHALLRRQRTP